MLKQLIPGPLLEEVRPGIEASVTEAYNIKSILGMVMDACI